MKNKLMTNQIDFKTCGKMFLNAPRDCLVSVSVPLYHQPARNTTLSLQFFMHFCVCVLCSGSLFRWPKAILGVTDTEQEVTCRIEDELTANKQLLSQTGIPQAWLAQQDYPKVSWRDALLHCSPVAPHFPAPPTKANMEKHKY